MAATDISWDDALAGVESVPYDQPVRDAPLFIVDGNNLAYRAFFALPEEMARSDGFPTGALTGFANLMAKILQEYRPKAVICTWDSRSAHRLALNPEYKANRNETPEAMKQQFPFFEPLADAFACHNVKVDGFEADDVIGTLARRAGAEGIQTCIVTNDRDAYQLVSDEICILASGRSFSDVRVYTPERVFEKVGVHPHQYPCYLGLKGDPGDNIVGVPGIGEKTAAQLVSQYGTLERLLESLDELKGKRRENLEAHADAARLAKTLATCIDDVPLEVDFQALLAGPRDFSKLMPTLESFEMFTLRDRLSRGRSS
jgi:DNA polymerase-1